MCLRADLEFQIWKKSFHRPSTINEFWFQSLILKTGYLTSLNYLNRPFLVPHWFDGGFWWCGSRSRMSGVSPTFFLLPHITFNNPLSLPPNVAGLRLLGPSASLRRLAASLRRRRHAQRPRRRSRLPNSLPSLPAEADRGSGSSAPREEL
jgi:hypothetical protein